MSLLIRSRQSVEKARWGLCRETVDKATVKAAAHYFKQITPQLHESFSHPTNLGAAIRVADTHAAALRWPWPVSPVTLYTTAEPVKRTSSSDLVSSCGLLKHIWQCRNTVQLIFI